jgi:hypothetical protein
VALSRGLPFDADKTAGHRDVVFNDETAWHCNSRRQVIVHKCPRLQDNVISNPFYVDLSFALFVDRKVLNQLPS